MAKGGNNQRSNCSRFTKPYDASNSFVRKVALRVRGYIGGLFGSSVKAHDSVSADKAPFIGTDDTNLTHSHYETTDSGKAVSRCYDDGANNFSGKTLKVGTKRKFVSDLPISPIASTSSLFQSSVNHNYDIQNSEDFIASVAGPSGLQNQKYAQANSITTSTSTNTNIKANGATDNHSDSSESTSGCSSLVPQSDRLSQSAFVSNSRKKILEEKLQYVRQLKQNRASVYLNRSIPVGGDAAGCSRKPSFDVSVYGSPIFIKSSVREKMVNSPFYTGQTSYGGASAYRRPRAALNSQASGRSTLDRKEGLQIQVKPSHHGSTEDLSNMSHTAKRILEALEQFSTPISDAKRIPVNGGSPPLGRKRTRYADNMESVASLSTLKTPSNLNKGPVISGLNIPTVPDLLKLKRLEKIQDSTAAARQVAVQKQEYSLPTDVTPSKHTGKIVTKIKDKEKEVNFERPPEVNLPKIPLPISTLPKFDFKLPPVAPPTVDNSATTKSFQKAIVDVTRNAKPSEPNKTFTFSPPISLSAPENIKYSIQKNSFTFSIPLKANSVREKSESAVLSNLSNFMSPEALSKLKRKAVTDKPNSTLGIEPSKELKCGSVMGLLKKTLENNKQLEKDPLMEKFKPKNGTWECNTCLIRNLNESKNCAACQAPKISVPPNKIVDNTAKPFTTVGSPVTTTNITFGSNLKMPESVPSSGTGFTFGQPSSVNSQAAVSISVGSNDSSKTSPILKFGFPGKSDQGGVNSNLNISTASQEKSSEPTASVTLTATTNSTFNSSENEETNKKTGADVPAVPFTFGVPSNAAAPTTTAPPSSTQSLFTFGIPASENKPLQASNSGFGQNNSTFTFGNQNITPSNTFGNANSTFGNNIANAFGQQSGNSDLNKPLPFPKFGFSGKSDQAGETKSIVDVGSVKDSEKISDSTASGVTVTTTTSSTFGTSESEKTKNKIGTESPAVPFTFGVPNNAAAPTTTAPPSSTQSLFTFGIPASENKPLQASNSGFGQNNSTFTFGNQNITPSNTFGNTNSAFGNNNANAFGQQSGNSDLNKPLPFPKFGFSGKSDQAGETKSIVDVGSVKDSEKISDSTASGVTVTTTTSSTFGTSESERTNNKIGTESPAVPFTFGVPSNPAAPTTAPAMPTSSANIFTFGAPKPEPKPIQFSGGFGQNNSTFTFGNQNPAPSNIFGNFNQPKVANSFGNTNSTFGNGTSTAFGQEGGNNDLNKPFRFPKFGFSGKSDQGGLTSNILNVDATKNIEKITDTNANSSALTTATNSIFGSSSESGGIMGKMGAGKPATPFVFGESNNNSAQTNSSAMPTTAPNVFTFGAPKPESKPIQFSSNFGQNSGTFTFGRPNPAPAPAPAPAPTSGNIFGNFNQPKTGSPFGNANTTFGNPSPNPFGQSSAPASFGGNAPKFEFGSSSQPTQSTQPFQFGAANPQTMASSTSKGFSISIPQTFNFTGGQTPTFSATPTSTPVGPTRRVARAVRRTQR